MKIFKQIRKIIPKGGKEGTVVRIDIYLKTENEIEIEDFKYGLSAFQHIMQKRGKPVQVFVNYLKELQAKGDSLEPNQFVPTDSDGTTYSPEAISTGPPITNHQPNQ